MTSEFSKTARTVYLGMVGPLLLTFPTTVLVARGLGPADKGLWSVMLQAFFVSEMVASLGAAAYYIVRLGSDLAVEQAMPTSMAQGFAMSTVVAVVAVLLVPGSVLGDHNSVTMRVVLAASLIALVVGRHLAHLGVGIGRPRIYAQATLSQAAVQLAAIVGFYATHRLTLLAVATSFGLGALTRLVVPLAVLLRTVRPTWRVDMQLWQDSLRFGWRRALSEIEDALNTRVPLLLLTAFSSLAAVGVYSISLGLAEVMGQTGAALSLAALRGFAQDRSRVADYSRTTIAMSCLLATVAIPLSFSIPLIFGDAYRGAEGQLLLLLPTVPVLAANRMLTSALSATDRVGAVARSGAASLIGITVLGLTLTPAFGANGASAALLGGLLIQTAMTSRRLALDAGLFASDLLVPRYADLQRVFRRSANGLVGRL